MKGSSYLQHYCINSDKHSRWHVSRASEQRWWCYQLVKHACMHCDMRYLQSHGTEIYRIANRWIWRWRGRISVPSDLQHRDPTLDAQPSTSVQRGGITSSEMIRDDVMVWRVVGTVCVRQSVPFLKFPLFMHDHNCCLGITYIRRRSSSTRLAPSGRDGASSGHRQPWRCRTRGPEHGGSSPTIPKS